MAIFRHVIVGKPLVPSKSGNCTIDADKIYLGISNVTVLQKQFEDVSLPYNISSIEFIGISMPAPSIQRNKLCHR